MIDRVVEAVASRVRFSSPSVRALRSSSLNPEKTQETLEDMYMWLTARDAKWLTRLILKSYEPVVIEPEVVYRAYHPLLPSVMHVHDHFSLAGPTLKRLNQESKVAQSPLVDNKALMQHLVPALGFKVGRQTWHKGRSIKHCLQMGYGRMTCEEKLDGEYCQIHIDLSKGARNCIQIFSKSGKDSTQDRKALHEYAGAPCPTAACTLQALSMLTCHQIHPRVPTDWETVVYSHQELHSRRGVGGLQRQGGTYS